MLRKVDVKKFGDIVPGTYFEEDGNPCLKIEEINSDENDVYNFVYLASGGLGYCDNIISVYNVDRYYLCERPNGETY